jgi:hypothetical protein
MAKERKWNSEFSLISIVAIVGIIAIMSMALSKSSSSSLVYDDPIMELDEEGNLGGEAFRTTSTRTLPKTTCRYLNTCAEYGWVNYTMHWNETVNFCVEEGCTEWFTNMTLINGSVYNVTSCINYGCLTWGTNTTTHFNVTQSYECIRWARKRVCEAIAR